MRILIVADLTATVAELTDFLREAGYERVFAVSTLQGALSTLGQAVGAGAAIDLILLDLDISDTDGIAATLTIKAHHEFEDTPIITLTGNNSTSILERAFAAGASDHMLKPVGNTELRARVRSALQLRKEMLKRMERERELERLARKLERMSNMDGLTGLANRRCFDDTMVREWVRNGREDCPIGLLMIDIDHFKKYNDAMGHVKGDICLSRVAKVIQEAVHRPGDLTARYGGEEFTVILPNTDYEGTCAVAKKIHEKLKLANMDHPGSNVSCSVTVSIGVASVIPTCDTTPEHLIKAADAALYQAKQTGRNRTESICLPAPDQLRQ